MLTLEQISEYFPKEILKRNPHGALVEYLQYELLDSLYKNKEAMYLSFIGGTAIRILQQSHRFSEDLDFDNFGLSFEQFDSLMKKSCRDMEIKGFLIEHRIVERNAYHCYIRFPEILHKAGITGDMGKKILIRIDMEAKKKMYNPQKFLLNKFAVYRQILTATVSVLLSQKMLAVLQRKREKGRDLYDVSFLLGITGPDFSYIDKYFAADRTQFLKIFKDRVDSLDLKYLAKDVEPFLFSNEQKERILSFREYWRQRSKSI